MSKLRAFEILKNPDTFAIPNIFGFLFDLNFRDAAQYQLLDLLSFKFPVSISSNGLRFIRLHSNLHPLTSSSERASHVSPYPLRVNCKYLASFIIAFDHTFLLSLYFTPFS